MLIVWQVRASCSRDFQESGAQGLYHTVQNRRESGPKLGHVYGLESRQDKRLMINAEKSHLYAETHITHIRMIL